MIKMAAQGHPSFNESIVLLGSSIAFVLENWDQFVDLIEMPQEEKEDFTKEIKPLFEHLGGDLAAQMQANEMVDDIARAMAKLFIR